MKKAFDNKETFEWCGYEWECCMEGKRIIHPDLPWYWMDKEQIFIGSDNTLYLYTKIKRNTVKYWNGKTYYPTCACGTIRSTKSFSYGTFSADIKLPEGSGLWPSFWLSGDYCWPPEIDIMEAWDSEKDYFNVLVPQFPYINPSWKVTTNVHYNDDTMVKKNCGSKNVSIFKLIKNPTKHFINYKVEWLPNSIKFYVDDKLVRTIDKEISEDLVTNITAKGHHVMDVIFNVWCENPETYKNYVFMDTPLMIKNFKYIPYE